MPTQHLDWISEYIVDRKPDVVIQIGDFWDMASLNPHRTKKEREGMRYEDDIQSGNAAWRKLWRAPRKAGLKCRRVFCGGNHEWFIVDAIEEDPKLDGKISLKDLDLDGWEFHDFKEIVDIDGVAYSHFFYHPMTGRPFTGTIDNRLRQLGHSFSMGHQQTLLHGIRFVRDRAQHGLVAGACYLHDEDYKGPQGNAHWRGVIVKHEVENGDYDPMFVSLNFLCRKYEGMSLERFKKLNKIKGGR